MPSLLQIESIPLEVFHEACHLQKLLMENMGLTAWPLPTQDGSLPSLVEFSIARNPIAEIPADAFNGCAGTLRDLDLSGKGEGNPPFHLPYVHKIEWQDFRPPPLLDDMCFGSVLFKAVCFACTYWCKCSLV